MVNLEQVNVTVSGGGSEGATIDGMMLSYAVGEIPTAQVNLHQANGDAAKPVLVGEEAIKMAEFQKLAFAGQGNRLTANVSVTGANGAENWHVFSGNVLGPTRKVYSSFYANGAKIVHEIEQVNSYVPHIYSLAYSVQRGTPELIDKQYSNVFVMLNELLKKRHEDFPKIMATAKFNDAASKQSLIQLHERNMEVYPIIERILVDSEGLGGPTYNGFSKFTADALRTLNTSVFNALKSTVFSINRQFFYALVALGEEFQSFFVPPFIGDSVYGYFKSHRYKVDEAQAADLRLIGASFSSSSLNMLPIQQVIVSGQPSKLNRKEKNNQENIFEFLGDNPTYGVFPKNPPKTNGNNFPVSIPSWIPSTLYEYKTQSKNTSRDLELDRRKESIVNLNELIKNEIQGPVADIVEEFGKTTYKNIALANYVVETSSTLNFNVIPGNRYKVSDEEGKELFSGFLHSVTHNISSLSSALDARTTMTFHAVTFSGFQLPE
jgi:hypothetical protein